MSSSPGLPSPSQLIKQNKQIIASGSRAVAVPAEVLNGFIRASTLLGREDINWGGAPPARLGLNVRGNEESGEAVSVKNIADGRQVDESVIGASVKKLGAPRRRVGGKKGAAQTAGNTGDEHVTAAGATVDRKRKAPRKNAAAGGKKLSSTMVTKDDDEDIILGEASPIEKPTVSHKKSTALPEKLDNPTSAEGERQDELSVKPAPTKKPRAPRKKPTAVGVQTVDSVVLEGDTEASKTIEVAPVKKSRVKKTKDDGQTKLKKGRIVKPPTGEELGEATTTKRSSKKRKSDLGNDLDLPLPMDAVSVKGTHESLGLDKATTRRRDWTPVMNGNIEAADDPHGLSSEEPMLSTIDITTNTAPANDLGAHLSHYNFNQAMNTEPLNAPVQDSDRPAPIKRRKLQLIDIPDHPPPGIKVAKKSKAPKKKPQTITEKATAPFLPNKPPNASPLLQYLTQSASPRVQPAEAPTAVPSVKGRGQKPLSKVTKPKAVKAKTRKPAPILLPPEEAMKAMKDQGLLFGTSSQLLSSESPPFVGDLQQAIKASESSHELPNTPEGDATIAAYLTGSTVLRRVSSRNLWSEAARDSQGSLLEPEVIDLMDTPDPREITRNVIAFAPMPEVDRSPKPLVEDASWTAIDDVQSPSLEAATEDGIAKSVFSETITVTNDALLSLPRCVAETALRPRLKNRSPEKKKKRLPGGQEDTTSQMPNYQGFTMNQLSVAISKYGFKPIKGRDAMIVLLERCWESKARLALQSLPPNLNVPSLAPPSDQRTTDKAEKTSLAKRKGRPPKAKDSSTTPEGEPSKSTTSPTKPRGRPKKSKLPPTTTTTDEPQSADQAPATPPKLKAKRKAATDETEDPDPPPTPSPPRRRSSLSPTQALPLTGLSKPLNSSTPSLFDSITEAITMSPPSNDSHHLSWHEKILLYDPIVLEDLTAWLNTEGLGRVGVDEEVGAEVVKEWCEGRSVCCLWREGRRGIRGKGAGKG